MIRYREFLDDIRRRVGLDTAEEAGALVETVLAGLDHWLARADSEQLATQLPAALRPALRAGRPQQHTDVTVFVQFVAFGTDRSPEQALYGAQAVFSALDAEDEKLAGWLRGQLPPSFGDVFGPQAGALLPGRQRGRGPAPLTDAEVARALAGLTDWQGDTRRLERVVAPPAPQLDELLDRVRAVEREVDHHALVERRDDGVAFLVWTHSVGAVTRYDVALAGRIDEVVATL